MVEDGRLILRGVRCAGRVVAAPEDVQQFLVGDSGRVKVYLNRLAVVAEAVVAGVFFGTSCISDAGTNYTVKAPEPGVRAPESAHGEGRRLGYLRRQRIYGRDRYIKSRRITCVIHHCILLLIALNYGR